MAAGATAVHVNEAPALPMELEAARAPDARPALSRSPGRRGRGGARVCPQDHGSPPYLHGSGRPRIYVPPRWGFARRAGRPRGCFLREDLARGTGLDLPWLGLLSPSLVVFVRSRSARTGRERRASSAAVGPREELLRLQVISRQFDGW
ncbi:unnamed protein product [Ixodes pacificus]